MKNIPLQNLQKGKLYLMQIPITSQLNQERIEVCKLLTESVFGEHAKIEIFTICFQDFISNQMKSVDSTTLLFPGGNISHITVYAAYELEPSVWNKFLDMYELLIRKGERAPKENINLAINTLYDFRKTFFNEAIQFKKPLEDVKNPISGTFYLMKWPKSFEICQFLGGNIKDKTADIKVFTDNFIQFLHDTHSIFGVSSIAGVRWLDGGWPFDHDNYNLYGVYKIDPIMWSSFCKQYRDDLDEEINGLQLQMDLKKSESKNFDDFEALVTMPPKIIPAKMLEKIKIKT